MDKLSPRHSFEVGWKLGRMCYGTGDDLTVGELQNYRPDADIDALVQGFEDGKRNDHFRLDLGRRLWKTSHGLR